MKIYLSANTYLEAIFVKESKSLKSFQIIIIPIEIIEFKPFYCQALHNTKVFLRISFPIFNP